MNYSADTVYVTVSSGLINFTDIPGNNDWEEHHHSRKELIDYVRLHPLDFKPGSKYEYSNTNYALLGFILEDIYKQTFNDLLQQKIANPLGLKNTYYSSDLKSNVCEAFSYNIQDEYLQNGKVNFSNHPASGGMLSTANEINIFLSALFNQKIINAESLKLMLPENRGEYGMGIEKLSFAMNEVFGHSGRIENFISSYWYFPTENLGIVTLSNSTNINVDDIQLVLARYAYGIKPELPNFHSADGISQADFAKLQGTYFSSDRTTSVTISSNGKSMIFQDSRAGQMYIPFEYKGNNRFEYENIVLLFETENKTLNLKQDDAQMWYSK